MIVVTHLADILLKLRPRSGREIRHILGNHIDAVHRLQKLFDLTVNIFVDDPGDIVLVRTPKSLLGIPYGIEGFPPHHKVFDPAYDKVGVNLNALLFAGPGFDSVEIHFGAFSSFPRFVTFLQKFLHFITFI